MRINIMMVNAKAFVQKLWRDETGQDLVEYALIVAAVGLALITTVNQLTQAVVGLYQNMVASLGTIGAQQ